MSVPNNQQNRIAVALKIMAKANQTDVIAMAQQYVLNMLEDDETFEKMWAMHIECDNIITGIFPFVSEEVEKIKEGDDNELGQ